MRISYVAIGRNIRAARLHAHLTQEELAEKLQISPMHFSRLERGERPISLEMLQDIATVLNQNPNALLCGCLLCTKRPLQACDNESALGDTVAALAAGCSARARHLMLTVCRDIAAAEKAIDAAQSE